jgi:chromosome segregation ATPase
MLETQYKERNIEIIKDKNYIKDLEQNVKMMDELKNKMQVLEEDNNKLQTEYDKHQKQIKDLSYEISNLRDSSDVKDLQSKLSQYIENIQKQEKSIFSQSNQISKINKSLVDCNKKSLEYVENVKVQLTQINDNKKMMEQLKNENDNLKSQLTEFQIIVMKEKTLLQTIEELKGELIKITREHKDIVDKLEVQVDNYRERNIYLLEAINELIEKAISRLDREKQSLNTENKYQRKGSLS